MNTFADVRASTRQARRPIQVDLPTRRAPLLFALIGGLAVRGAAARATCGGQRARRAGHCNAPPPTTRRGDNRIVRAPGDCREHSSHVVAVSGEWHVLRPPRRARSPGTRRPHSGARLPRRGDRDLRSSAIPSSLLESVNFPAPAPTTPPNESRRRLTTDTDRHVVARLEVAADRAEGALTTLEVRGRGCIPPHALFEARRGGLFGVPGCCRVRPLAGLVGRHRVRFTGSRHHWARRASDRGGAGGRRCAGGTAGRRRRCRSGEGLHGLRGFRPCPGRLRSMQVVRARSMTPTRSTTWKSSRRSQQIQRISAISSRPGSRMSPARSTPATISSPRRSTADGRGGEPSCPGLTRCWEGPPIPRAIHGSRSAETAPPTSADRPA